MLVLAAAFLMRTASRNGHLAAAAAGLANVVAPSVEAPIEEAAASAAENKDSGKTATVSRGQRTTSPRGRIVPLQSAGAGEMTPDTIAVPVADSLTPDRVAELPRYDAAYEIVAHGAGSQETVYSRIDHSVSPPRQVYPALPAKPSPGIRAEDLTVLDLVISAEGVVERVRVRTPPHDVREFMLVSAAKAWRFEPATLDGRPVRFLHSVAITTD
jgi:hypothetical protein